MTDSELPPPVLGCARVLEYAIVDARVRYTGAQRLFSGGQWIGAMPRLAIVRNIPDDALLVLYCDDDWESHGAAEYETVEEAKRAAEKHYDGITRLWQQRHATDDEVSAHLAEHFPPCSFCGRALYAVAHMIGVDPRICDRCIDEFHQILQEERVVGASAESSGNSTEVG
jgi:hypothetical protein